MKQKKAPAKSRGNSHKAKHSSDNRPIEFERAWQDLEDQNARLQVDWTSLAAQIVDAPRNRAF